MSLPSLFQDARTAVDDVLTQYLTQQPDIPSPLLDAMATSIKNGGKRLRPLLTLLCSGLFQVPKSQAARVGTAIEMVHCYSLIHDDLPAMDNADTRRGHPSCWREFGEATAILAGDSLLPLAFEVLADEATHPSASVRLALIKGLAQSSGAEGMAGGQMLDLSPHLIDSVEKSLKMQSLKTGCLFAFSCEAGAILGGASLEDRERLRQFGYKFGLAYQIKDDLLDIEGTTEEIGKPAGIDDHKMSLVSLLGISGSKVCLSAFQDEMSQVIGDYQNPLFDELIEWVATRKS